MPFTSSQEDRFSRNINAALTPGGLECTAHSQKNTQSTSGAKTLDIIIFITQFSDLNPFGKKLTFIILLTAIIQLILIIF